MNLRPLIASYSGESASAIRGVLDARALEIVARVTETGAGGTWAGGLDRDLLLELVEMRVLRDQHGRVRLDTAVFLENDIRRANDFALDFGARLADVVAPLAAAPELAGLHPAVLNFLVGIVAIGQSLHTAMKADGLAVDWSQWGGRFARSKVDFEEVCEEAHRLEPDLQNKGVIRGRKFTAALIGPGGNSFLLKPWEPGGQAAGAARHAYLGALNHYLTDAFPLLLLGKTGNESLKEAAQQVGLFKNGRPEPLVITNENIAPCIPALERISAAAKECYYQQLGWAHEILSASASGRQGVPDSAMSMHLWRYARRGISRALYAKKVFTDNAPETGLITVFYENEVEYLKGMG